MNLTQNLIISALSFLGLFAGCPFNQAAGQAPATPTISFGSSAPLLLHFGYMAPGNTTTQTFQFTGQNITSNLTLTAPDGFELSKNNTAFSSSIVYTPSESNNNNEVFIRFRPLQANKGFGGSVSFTATGLTLSRPDLSGSSLPPSLSLDVVAWNIAWFGSTSNGPTDEDRQQFYASVVMDSLNADLYILQEIVDTSRLGSLARSLKNGPYSYVVAPYASLTTTNTNATWRSAQKLAYIYRTQLFTINSVRGFTNTSTHPNNYYNWASGRFPFLLDAWVTVDGITKRIAFLNLHAKAESGELSDYERRRGAAELLYDSVNVVFPTQHVLIAGDYNDDLDETISSVVPGFSSPYLKFMNDPVRYNPVSYWNTLRGDNSYIGYPNVIDHSIVSNEMQLDYVPFSCILRKDAANWVPFYRTDLTDHYPLQSRFYLRQSAVNQVTATRDPIAPIRWVEVLTPAGTEPSVRFLKNMSGPVSIRLFNANGQLAGQRQVTAVRSGQLVPIPRNGPGTGVYILSLTGKEGSFTTKLVLR